LNSALDGTPRHSGSGSTGCERECLSESVARAAQNGLQLLDGAFLVAHLADAKELNFSRLGWGDEEARRFAAALEHAHEQGALKALETLYLSANMIGDEGVRHLSDALARGAAPALKTLGLSGNQIGDYEWVRHLSISVPSISIHV
jgi:hypothetical protein